MSSRDRDDGMPEFDLALWGYHRGQVDRCLEDLSARLEDALGQIAAVDAVHEQLCRATLELDQLRRAVPHRDRWAEKLSAIMEEAGHQAAALRAEAERDAEQIRARARTETLEQARTAAEAGDEARTAAAGAGEQARTEAGEQARTEAGKQAPAGVGTVPPGE